MKKIMLGLLLFGLVASARSEMIAPGVELVSHKTWITGNGYGHTEDDKGIFFSSASAGASVSSFYGKTYQNIQMNAYHYFSMQNTSKQTKSYTVSIKLCADSSSCIHDERTYNVNSGGSYSNNTTTYLTKSFSRVGTYSLAASTSVSGESSANDNSNASIIVSK
jgi:hypothetical protein